VQAPWPSGRTCHASARGLVAFLTDRQVSDPAVTVVAPPAVASGVDAAAGRLVPAGVERGQPAGGPAGRRCWWPLRSEWSVLDSPGEPCGTSRPDPRRQRGRVSMVLRFEEPRLRSPAGPAADSGCRVAMVLGCPYPQRPERGVERR
jgi:hypothetical protein